MFDFWVFNEQSLPFPNPQEANDNMGAFFACLRKGAQVGLSVVRAHPYHDRGWYSISLAPNYTFGNWAKEQPPTEGDRLKDLIANTKVPYWASTDREAEATHENSIYSLPGGEDKNYASLGAAYSLEVPALSMLSHPRWDTSSLTLIHCTEAGEKEVNVEHAARPLHVMEWAQRLQDRRQEAIRGYRDFWENRGTLFPHLVFLDRIEDDLRKYYGQPAMTSVREKLKQLNAFAKAWKEGEVAAYRSDELRKYLTTYSNESESVNKNPKLKKERKVRLPDGNFTHFFDHEKCGDLRLYFGKDTTTRTVYVGMIIPHPGSKKY